METLRIGDRFPELHGSVVDDSTLLIPHELEGIHAVLLFYRGHW